MSVSSPALPDGIPAEDVLSFLAPESKSRMQSDDCLEGGGPSRSTLWSPLSKVRRGKSVKDLPVYEVHREGSSAAKT